MSRLRSGLRASLRNHARQSAARTEANRRHRRLFLEPLENRALLTVLAIEDHYETAEDTPLYITVEGVPGSEPGEFLAKPGVLFNDEGESLIAELVTEAQ